MKPFNLEEAKAGKPVCTRDGKDVVILNFFDYHCAEYHEHNIIAKIILNNGDEITELYGQNGQMYPNCESPKDLQMKTTHKEGYTTMSYDYLDNLKRGCAGRYKMFENRADLLKYYGEQIPIVKIEWEE